jgi:dimeric dUTPase (all-alpha-NTP-PPase superfamily)
MIDLIVMNTDFQSIIGLQSHLQRDILINDPATAEYFCRQGILPLIDEIFEFEEEVSKESELAKINEEYIDIILFAINIGLYHKEQTKMSITKLGDIWDGAARDVVAESLSKKSQDTAFTKEMNASDCNTCVEIARGLLRFTDWKPWKQTGRHVPVSFQAQYVKLLQQLFRMMRYTSLNFNNETFTQQYLSKHDIVATRARTGY